VRTAILKIIVMAKVRMMSKDQKYHEKEYRNAYLRYMYHKRRNRVLKKLGYECDLCGHDDSKQLEIHYQDRDMEFEKHGRGRVDEAIELLDDGRAEELELLCKSCAGLLDLGRDREEIKELKDGEDDG